MSDQNNVLIISSHSSTLLHIRRRDSFLEKGDALLLHISNHSQSQCSRVREALRLVLFTFQIPSVDMPALRRFTDLRMLAGNTNCFCIE